MQRGDLSPHSKIHRGKRTVVPTVEAFFLMSMHLKKRKLAEEMFSVPGSGFLLYPLLAAGSIHLMELMCQEQTARIPSLTMSGRGWSKDRRHTGWQCKA